MKIANTTIERVPIDSIQPHPANPRQGDVGAVAESLDEHGFFGVCVCQVSTRYILAGNHRWKAAKFKGATEIDVAWVDCDDDEALRILLVDNRTSDMATYDDVQLAELLQSLAASQRGLAGTGYDGDALDELLRDLDNQFDPGSGDPGAAPPDRGEELAEQWGVTRGSVWQIGAHTLTCGDAMTAQIDAVPLVVTSPPYAVGLDYGDYDDSIQNLRTLIVGLAGHWKNLVTPGGYMVVNFTDIVSASGIVGASEPCEYPMAVEYWPVFREHDWVLHTRRIWAKPHARVTAPWTAITNRAAADWEHIWTWKRPGDGLNERRDPSFRGVWDTSHEEGLDVGKGDHPAGFPTQIPRWAIEVYSHRGDTVAEPFCGTGTTIVAAEQTGRVCKAWELDPRYTAITLDRLDGMGLSVSRTA
jgi:DNA modification methylase